MNSLMHVGRITNILQHSTSPKRNQEGAKGGQADDKAETKLPDDAERQRQAPGQSQVPRQSAAAAMRQRKKGYCQKAAGIA